MNRNWTSANLSDDQLRTVSEAKQVLGTEILRAYRGDGDQNVTMPQRGLHTVALDESQVECLQGMEQKVQAVIVAYKNRND